MEDLRWPPEVLQQVWGVQALEMIGTRAARDSLRELAAGIPNARLIHDTRNALRRLANYPVRR
jgi:hypothetical protein